MAKPKRTKLNPGHLRHPETLLTKEVNNFMDDLLLKCALRGVSQRKLAARMNCSQQNLFQYCKSGAIPGLRFLVKIRYAISDIISAQEFRDLVTRWSGF